MHKSGLPYTIGLMAAKGTRSQGLAYPKGLREHAERLFAAGEKQSAVARRLGVSRQCVHNWYWQWRNPKPAKPVKRKNPKRRGAGRRSKLDDGRWSGIDAALRRGPGAYGFAGQRWTLLRIATVIEKITGVYYHPSSVWRILRGLGWTLRLPPKSKWKPHRYVPREWKAPTRRRSGEAKGRAGRKR